MTHADLLRPTYAHNMRLIGHSDQGGRSDGQQIMVRNGYAYIGHVCSKGFSIVDVRDPTRPKTVNYIQNPPNTWSLHLQVHDDLLLLAERPRDHVNDEEQALPEHRKDVARFERHHDHQRGTGGRQEEEQNDEAHVERSNCHHETPAACRDS